jgi:hypothetical protein
VEAHKASRLGLRGAGGGAVKGGLKVFVLIVNAVSLAAYMAWMISVSDRVFYTQEGILYFLPCLPLFFVFAWYSKRD